MWSHEGSNLNPKLVKNGSIGLIFSTASWRCFQGAEDTINQDQLKIKYILSSFATRALKEDVNIYITLLFHCYNWQQEPYQSFCSTASSFVPVGRSGPKIHDVWRLKCSLVQKVVSFRCLGLYIYQSKMDIVRHCFRTGVFMSLASTNFQSHTLDINKCPYIFKYIFQIFLFSSFIFIGPRYTWGLIYGS